MCVTQRPEPSILATYQNKTTDIFLPRVPCAWRSRVNQTDHWMSGEGYNAAGSQELTFKPVHAENVSTHSLGRLNREIGVSVDSSKEGDVTNPYLTSHV